MTKRNTHRASLGLGLVGLIASSAYAQTYTELLREGDEYPARFRLPDHRRQQRGR